MMEQFEARVNRTLLCQWLDLPRSVYYYQSQSGTAGAKPSQTTMKLDRSWVELERYFSHYNYHRLHRSIGFMTPQQKWEEAALVYDTTFSENPSS